jgi:phage shock protein A
MALISRLSRLFSADFHAVLDRIEEPELLLKQAVREMEEELARGEQKIKWLQQEQRQLAASEADTEQSLCALEEELDVCFASGKDELARKLTRRKLEARSLLKSINTRHSQCSEGLRELKNVLADNREQLELMRQKAEVLVRDEAAGASWRGDGTIPGATIGDDEVEVAFLKEQQRRARS